MLFSSLEFLFLFLPITLFGYYCFCIKRAPKLATYWLTGASLFFYGWWNPHYLLLLGFSIILNFFFAKLLLQSTTQQRTLLAAGISSNLALLGYFKYTNFLVFNLNSILAQPLTVEHIILPLGISFFTFQQISFLVDCYRGDGKLYKFTEYVLFVCFFPQLIAGPIVHHKEMMPQFSQLRSRILNWKNLYYGIFLFGIGLFKKVVIADPLAPFVHASFEVVQHPSFLDAWAGSLCYTMQLYFDFSGYSDMAIGLGLLFNISLPANFNSPYKALSIQDFWRRWHMTLSRWLRDYIYIPLGGNRKGSHRLLLNLFLTFFIGGIWHGAGWTFIIWGAMHGFALIIHRLWRAAGLALSKPLAWLCTFLFINFAWVIFRAQSIHDALKIYAAMLGASGFGAWSSEMLAYYDDAMKANPSAEIKYLAYAAALCFLTGSSLWLVEKFGKTRAATAFATGALTFAIIFILQHNYAAEFIYFQF